MTKLITIGTNNTVETKEDTFAERQSALDGASGTVLFTIPGSTFYSPEIGTIDEDLVFFAKDQGCLGTNNMPPVNAITTILYAGAVAGPVMVLKKEKEYGQEGEILASGFEEETAETLKILITEYAHRHENSIRKINDLDAEFSSKDDDDYDNT